jgi:plastocyanin
MMIYCRLAILILCTSVGFLSVSDVFADTTNIIIIKGSSVKGCQYSYSCVQPNEISASIGDTVIWKNQDDAIHLIVSGSPENGPDGWFSSSIIGPGETFSYTFTDAGPYPYFDILHPWDTGVIIVQKANHSNNFYYDEQIRFWKKMGWQ